MLVQHVAEIDGYIKDTVNRIGRDYAQSWASVDWEESNKHVQDAAAAMARFAQSPHARAMAKMAESKGIFEGNALADRVWHVPDAVLQYGFAHMPTKTDPEGQLYQELPPAPSMDWSFGSYLFFPEEEAPATSLKPKDRRFYHEAEAAFRSGTLEFPTPTEVLRVLVMEPLIDQVFVRMDPRRALKKQFAEFSAWYERARRSLYGKGGQRGHKKREPGRDTLIYILAESLDLSRRKIAEKVFSDESQERTVISSLSRTRAALNAAGCKSRHRDV